MTGSHWKGGSLTPMTPCVAIISHARYVLKSDRNDRPRHCESSKLMINRQSTHCDGATEPSVPIF